MYQRKHKRAEEGFFGKPNKEWSERRGLKKLRSDQRSREKPGDSATEL